MKATTKWKKGFSSVITNNRNHEIITDLPSEKGGDNLGATAFEICLMSYSGCVLTIFSMIAQKMRIDFSSLEVDALGEQNNGSETFSDVKINMRIQTQVSNTKLEKCLQLTLETCPVGILFHQAGVNTTYEIVKMQEA